MNRRTFITSLPHVGLVRIGLALMLTCLVCLAAIGIWQGRDILAIGAILILGVTGLNAFVAALPLSEAVRARIAKRKKLSDLYHSYRYQIFLWLGIGASIGKFIHTYPAPFNFREYLVYGVLILIGIIASLIWKLKHRDIASGA